MPSFGTRPRGSWRIRTCTILARAVWRRLGQTSTNSRSATHKTTTFGPAITSRWVAVPPCGLGKHLISSWALNWIFLLLALWLPLQSYTLWGLSGIHECDPASAVCFRAGSFSQHASMGLSTYCILPQLCIQQGKEINHPARASGHRKHCLAWLAYCLQARSADGCSAINLEYCKRCTVHAATIHTASCFGFYDAFGTANVYRSALPFFTFWGILKFLGSRFLTGAEFLAFTNEAGTAASLQRSWTRMHCSALSLQCYWKSPVCRWHYSAIRFL